MQLKDRVTVIDENIMNELQELYGDMSFSDLKRIVNNHMKVAVDEIREDLNMNRVPHCSECDCVKCVDYAYKIYYCDNEDRTDDMGRLSTDNLPKTSPKWCPKRKGNEHGRE